MKIRTAIILLIFLPTISLAASNQCANNHNKARQLYMEGGDLYDQGEENYEAFSSLEQETRNTYHLDRLFNRPTQKNATDNIISAVKLLNTAIKQTRKAKDKYARGNHYSDKAQDYCYDDDYESTKSMYDNAQIHINRIHKKLTGEDDLYSSFTPDYTVAKYELLAGTIRITMTDAAIYLIENENIDLNHISEGNRPLVIIAAENGSTEIARALISNGADIDTQNKHGYSAIEIAAISGNHTLFTYLFKHKALTFQLSGFNKLPKYKTCNLADMVQLSSYSEELREFIAGSKEKNEHANILGFLKMKGLAPVCNLNPLLATVNNEMIYQNDIDLLFTVKVIPEYHNENTGQKMPASDKIKFEKDILQYLVDQHLQVQLAETLGIEVDKEKVDKYVAQIHNRTNNVKYGQVRNYIENELLSKKVVQQEVIDKISIQDSELKEFYANNPDKFSQPESIHVRHILMADQNKLAAVLLLARNDGSDFAKLAKEYSEGPSSIKGGDLGFFQQGQMVKPFSDSAFALSEGDVSDIVETKYGFHIIKLIERKPAGLVPFAKIKDRLYEHMKQQRSQEEVKKWIESLSVNATIEIL